MTDDYAYPEVYTQAQNRVNDLLASRGIITPKDPGFDTVAQVAFYEAVDLGYQRNADAKNDTDRKGHLYAYAEVAKMEEDELAKVLESFRTRWHYREDVGNYSYCEQCGDDGGRSEFSITVSNGKMSMNHTFGCYGGEGFEDVDPKDVLEYLHDQKSWLDSTVEDYERSQAYQPDFTDEVEDKEPLVEGDDDPFDDDDDYVYDPASERDGVQSVIDAVKWAVAHPAYGLAQD